MRLGGITKGIDNYDVTPSLRTNITEGEATSNNILPNPQPASAQASANPPQKDAGPIEYDDDPKDTEASRGRRTWRTIAKKTLKLVKPVVTFLVAAAAIVRTVVDLVDTL